MAAPLTELTPSEQREIIKADLLGKFQREDWHGVMDCAADLRDHDEYQRGLSAGRRQVFAASGVMICVYDLKHIYCIYDLYAIKCFT